MDRPEDELLDPLGVLPDLLGDLEGAEAVGDPLEDLLFEALVALLVVELCLLDII